MFNSPALSHWSSISVEDCSYKAFSRFISTIVALDDSGDKNRVSQGIQRANTWVKWKDYSNQVVIETERYFYKLYKMPADSGWFIAEARAILGELYRARGVHWEVTTIVDGSDIYQLEQREKLRVCDSTMDYGDILLSWNGIQQELEERMQLGLLTSQLKQHFPGLSCVKLIRDCANKFEDYAIKDGQVYLLDDADWFLALVDKDGNWQSGMFDAYELEYPEGCFFTAWDYYDRIENNELNVDINRWMVYKGLGKASADKINELRSLHEINLQNVIKLMVAGDKGVLEQGVIQQIINKTKE